MSWARALLILMWSLVSMSASGDAFDEFSAAMAAADVTAASAALERMEQGSLAEGIGRAALMSLRGDDGGAEALLRELGDRHPMRPEPLNNLAALYARANRLDDARELLEQALDTHPAYRVVHANLADVYERLAARAYARALPEADAPATDALMLIRLEPAAARLDCVPDSAGQ